MKSWAQKYQKKLLHPKDLKRKARDLKSNSKTIVTLNGSFDLLHAGHLTIIFEASLLADILIVALNSDSSIKKYKSKNRPIIPLKYRLQMLSALEFVNYVTYFDETDPINILSAIKPNIHVNGSEYGKDCIEADIVKKYGGKIHLVKLKEGLSTTKIIEKIKLCEK